MSSKFGLEDNYVTQSETGSSITPPRLPSCKSVRYHYSAADGSISMQFGRLT